MIKAVIFDVDGTPVDSNYLHVGAEAAAKAGSCTAVLLSGGFGEGSLREAGAAAVYRAASAVLDNFDESPFAKAGAGAVRGQG